MYSLVEMVNGADLAMLYTLARKGHLVRAKISVAFSNWSHDVPTLNFLHNPYPDDEKTNSLKPLRPHHISVASGSVTASPSSRASSSGHVIATLDTIPLSHPSPNTSEAAEAADSP